ncbi:MAG: single-stranded-DNA-specific exonuclease RecJ [Holosporales bacterium]|jgi:single-stranded-DNA-specific exonuclease|nr:single-stranded-DNA-specific exonuclease RecJ [Holosporales bacterium]
MSNKSFTGRAWNFLKCDDLFLRDVKTRLNLPDLVARIFLNRSFNDIEEIEAFLNAKLKNTIPDPSLLLDMDKGVARLVEAINKNQKIMILGDYDVDGITSTYLMVKYLSKIGVESTHYIPSRFSDGYGLGENAINIAIENKIDLLIVVDSGINSTDAVEMANNAGIDVIIIDHHLQSSEQIPRAVAVIDPSRTDQCEIGYSGIKYLCAAGVVYLFLIALQRSLKDARLFERVEKPDLLEFSGVVAIGTLCDVMELKGINRAIIKYALENARYPIGILSLMSEFNLEKISSIDDFAFFIGPAINAAGRVDDPHVALNLLLEERPEYSQKIAAKLIEMNKKRRALEKQSLSEALCMIAEKDLVSGKGICVFGNNWHDGVIGIIAGKLKEKFGKPTFVISFNDDGIGKGSARSVPGLHLGEFFKKLRKADLIISGGGHAFAGGFSISNTKIQDFCEFVKTSFEGEFDNSINIDCSFSPLSDISQIAIDLQKLEPFGRGFERPIVCVERARIRSIKQTNSGDHLMIFLSGELGEGSVKTILFHSKSKKDVVTAIEENKDSLLDVVGRLSYHEQYGASLIIDDLRLTTSP